MNALLSLWLPILLSAVVVFVISSLVHMVFKWHRSDYSRLANEDAVREAVRAGQPSPGLYLLPYCDDMKEMAGEVMMKKYREGPTGFLTIVPNGLPRMGLTLGLWFGLTLVVATLAAFLALQAFGLDPDRARDAGQLVGSVTFLAYGVGSLCESIWMGRSWTTTGRFLLDAALYGIGSGLVFAWLWP
jgi:hypothetical protein